MKRQLEQVREFHKAMGVHENEYFDYLTIEGAELRRKLIAEEFREWELAQKTASGREDVLDGLVDLLYVVFGTVAAHGISGKLLLEAFDEVHHTNMAKLGGEKRADGKILKPEGWKPPDLVALIKKHA